MVPRLHFVIFVMLMSSIQGSQRDCDQTALLAVVKPNHTTKAKLPAEALEEIDTAWDDVIQRLIHFDWNGEAVWPRTLWNEWGFNHWQYKYGAFLLGGVWYQSAFLQVSTDSLTQKGNESNGTQQGNGSNGLHGPGDPTFWNGFGKALASFAGAIPGPYGKIISGGITLGFALFGSDGILDAINDAIDKLYKKIMAEVKQMLNEQLVNASARRAQSKLQNLMSILAEMPNKAPRDWPQKGNESLIQNWNGYFNSIDTVMMTARPAIFGDMVGCVVDIVPQNPPPETCVQFCRQGVFFWQLQFVMIHLSLRATWGMLYHDKYEQKRKLDLIRRLAGQYYPALAQSYDIYRSWPDPTCSYKYPVCFGCNTYTAPREQCLARCSVQFGTSCTDEPALCSPATFDGSGFLEEGMEFQMAEQMKCSLRIEVDPPEATEWIPRDLCNQKLLNSCTIDDVRAFKGRWNVLLDQKFGGPVWTVHLLSEPIKDAARYVRSIENLR